MKTIAVIGGMGPQASMHAHSRLIQKLRDANKKAHIVHVSLQIKPFYESKPRLHLSAKQRRLLWLDPCRCWLYCL